jgi:hypothetical protein
MPNETLCRSASSTILIAWFAVILAASGCGRRANAAPPPTSASLPLPAPPPQAQVAVPEGDPEVIGFAESLYAGTPQPRAKALK